MIKCSCNPTQCVKQYSYCIYWTKFYHLCSVSLLPTLYDIWVLNAYHRFTLLYHPASRWDILQCCNLYECFQNLALIIGQNVSSMLLFVTWSLNFSPDMIMYMFIFQVGETFTQSLSWDDCRRKDNLTTVF